MLYEFHRNENAKKPQSVHATYVISGFHEAPSTETPVTNGQAKEKDEDEVMRSSPGLPSSMPNNDVAPSRSPRVMSIVIAREEDLEGKPRPHSRRHCALRPPSYCPMLTYEP